jgi:uncharacterized protein (TIGR02147 family)
LESIILDHLKLLNEAAETYCKNAGGISKRKLSQSLKLSPAYLSQVLNGKRQPSASTLVGMCRQLGLHDEVISKILTSTSLKKSSRLESQDFFANQMNRQLVADQLQFSEIPSDRLGVLRHWVSLAILESFEDQKNVMQTVDELTLSVSKRFLVSPMDASIAIERLVALGYLKIAKNQILKRVKNVTTPIIPSASIRKYYQSILMKAHQAIDVQAPTARDYSVMTMCIDPDKLPEAARRIEHFRRDLMSFLESGNRREVYALNINLFSLEGGKTR